MAGSPHLAQIESELREGGQFNSVRKIGLRWGFGKTAIGDHKGHMLARDAAAAGLSAPEAPPGEPDAVAPSTPATAPTAGPSSVVPAAPSALRQEIADRYAKLRGHDDPQPSAKAPRPSADSPADDAVPPTARPTSRGQPPAPDPQPTIAPRLPADTAPAVATSGGHTQGAAVGTAPPRTPIDAGAAPVRAVLVPAKPSPAAPVAPTVGNSSADLSYEERVQADRLRQVADILAVGMWRGWPTTVALAEKWKILPEDVDRLHRLASRRVETARGSVREQRENSIAVLRRIRDEDFDASNRYAKEAGEIAQRSINLATSSVAGVMEKVQRLNLAAKTVQKLAESCRRSALMANDRIDRITIEKPDFQISYLGNLDFDKVFHVVARILAVVAPEGTAERLEEGVARWEEGGDDALVPWMREQMRVATALPAGDTGAEAQLTAGEGAVEDDGL